VAMAPTPRIQELLKWWQKRLQGKPNVLRRS